MFCGAVLVAMVMVPTVGQSQEDRKLFRWVDENGKVHFSDRLPPGAVNYARRVYNEEGRAVEDLDEAKDAETLRAEERARALAEEKARQDRILLQTFSSEQAIAVARDDRLSNIDATIAVTEDIVLDIDGRLNELLTQVENLRANGRPVPARLEAEIGSLENQLTNQRAFLADKHQERREVEGEFANALKRYRELRGIETSTGDDANAVAAD